MWPSADVHYFLVSSFIWIYFQDWYNVLCALEYFQQQRQGFECKHVVGRLAKACTNYHKTLHFQKDLSLALPHKSTRLLLICFWQANYSFLLEVWYWKNSPFLSLLYGFIFPHEAVKILILKTREKQSFKYPIFTEKAKFSFNTFIDTQFSYVSIIWLFACFAERQTFGIWEESSIKSFDNNESLKILKIFFYKVMKCLFIKNIITTGYWII